MNTAEDETQPEAIVKSPAIRNILQNDKKATTPARYLQNTNHTARSMAGLWVQLGQEIRGDDMLSYFGKSVAISKDGSTIVAGGHNGGTNDSGYVKAFHFNKEGEQWVQVGQMIEGEIYGDRIGWSIDLNDGGDIIVIGAYYSGGNGRRAGRVRIYHLIDDQWVQKGQDLDGQDSYNEFGYDVAISSSGDRVTIGGRLNDGNGDYSGHVQVYDYDKSTQKWEQVGQDILGESSQDQSGFSVDMNDAGDVIIIGAPLNDDGGINAGHARIYQLIEGQWVQKGQDLDGQDSFNQFGHAVAISGKGDRVTVGGPHGDYPGYVQAYEYDQSTQRWEQVGQDMSYDGKPGWSVEMNDAGDTIIIGTPDGNYVGQARIYHLVEGQWVQKGQDLDGGYEGERFGDAVAISSDGNRVIIGAPHSNVHGKHSGYIKVFEFSSSCDESPLKILTRKSKKSAKSCDFISDRADKFCQLEKYQTHCPSSCGVCDTFGSSDSTGTFLYNGKKKDCQWLRDLFASSSFSEIKTLCQTYELSATCRETCSFFVDKCEEE